VEVSGAKGGYSKGKMKELETNGKNRNIINCIDW
jgi:hypothetical protein